MEIGQWVKHSLKVKHYIRYADDFVLLHQDRKVLVDMLAHISAFLDSHLKLSLHPDEVCIETIASGVDFLGWVHFPTHAVLRATTKRRMFEKLEANEYSEATAQSYLGMLRHGNTHRLAEKMHCATS